MTATQCTTCGDEGWVWAACDAIDACGRCALAAELDWVAHESNQNGSEDMGGLEQAGPGGAGTVTAACIWVGGEPTFELVVHPALLRAIPWYRGGRDVSVVCGQGHDAGVLQITHPGPHRLLARMQSRLDKFPPVVLRVPRLDHLRPAPAAAVPVAYDVRFGQLDITLPEWARPPVPRTAPVTSFGALALGGVR